ncbi:hypothetical protein V6N13_020969 [Hibiscus sabdariffa]
METNPGVTVIGAEAPSAYQMAPRTENANQIGGGGSAAVDVSSVSVGLTSSIEKKKRGRPRRYGPPRDNGEGIVADAYFLVCPVPAAEVSSRVVAESVGEGEVVDYQIKHHKGTDMENLGEWAATSVGTNFTPHVITVNAGEVISFSQQGPRAICILSASGVISNVTLRQPDSSGGTLTYEGRFEILCLSGSFMPTETQGTRSRSGGMSVSLASADGRVVGGGVAGLLIAACPVQVVVGSFLRGNQNDQKAKKQKIESIPATVAPNPSIVTAPSSNVEKEDGMDVVLPQQNSNAMKPNLTAATFRRENWVTSMQSQGIRQPVSTFLCLQVNLKKSESNISDSGG